MFTTVAWSQSQDTSNALTAVAAVADPHVRVSGNDIIVPSQVSHLFGVLAVGASITRARLESPSLRRFLNYEIAQVDRNTLPATPSRYHDISRNPIPLDAEEALNATVAEDAVGAERDQIIAMLSDGAASPVDGDIRATRATGTTTLTANAWTNVAITFAEVLPAGRYQVVGFRARSSNLLVARLVFVGYQWRPGCIGNAVAGDIPFPVFRNGRLGVWGEFAHNTPPTVDCLANTADTAETFELDLIKIA